jgi:hypothetical protein
MFSAHAPLLPGIPLPLPDASNTPNSSDAATTLQGEEIDKYVHRYLSLSAYVEKKNKRCSSYHLFIAISFPCCRYTPPNIVSIEDLNSRRVGELFIGDIMVVYSTYLDKVNKTRKILRADMTDEHGMLTVTLTIPAHLIQRHQHKILPGSGISIAHFKVLPKTNYDRGDCDQIISLDESSLVEKLSPVCKEYTFIPNTTIRQFADNMDMYPIGTIGAVITLARKIGLQYTLHIKDGNTDNDKGMVQSPMFILLSLSF